ncbi:serine/threonine-protein kinase, partial [Planomonospora alba]|uniref:serine/threonine-protein kinase n=1 Tax=Planomonospora alba TaxID=161354 RepID=UPI0031E6A3C7
MIAGRYRLVRELGRGGMGVVWEGHDTVLDRPVAVKEVLLPPHLPPTEQERQLARTSREARTAARLNHHGIVAVYDVAEEDGRPWIIMELVRARGLDEVGVLPVRQVAAIGRQVLAALQAAHRAGIMHRDVKPSNILLAPDGRAVLTDFGIATVEGDASLTQTGMVTGSPSFLPPERAVGGEAGPWSDLWSLGATLYAMLTDGRGPFERRDAMATLGALLSEEVDLGRVHPAMREVLAGLLRRDPAHRLTAEQADVLLAGVSGEAPAPARRTAEGRPGPAAGHRAEPGTRPARTAGPPGA